MSNVADKLDTDAPLLREDPLLSSKSVLLLKYPSFTENVLQAANDLEEFCPPLKSVLASWFAGVVVEVEGVMMVM